MPAFAGMTQEETVPLPTSDMINDSRHEGEAYLAPSVRWQISSRLPLGSSKNTA